MKQTQEATDYLLLLGTQRQVISSRVLEGMYRRFDQALAAERRATVERIRAALHSQPYLLTQIDAILDAEAER